MNLFNKTIGAFIILLSFLFVSASFLPSKQIIKAEINIKSNQADVFNQVNILKNRTHWSPFIKDGNNFKPSFNQISKGTSARMTYQYSNKNTICLKIVSANSTSKVTNEILINSTKKIKSKWELAHNANTTTVLWEMEFEELSYPFERVMGLALKLKLQNDMNTGLENLKKYLES